MWAVIALTFLVAFIAQVSADTMPPPFTRSLKLSDPYMSGNDVLIAQNLLKREPEIKSMPTNGKYDEATAQGCASFQATHGLKATGTLDSVTAQLLLDLDTADGFKDTGFTAGSMGYLYKFHIPVQTNRSIETYATLYDKDNNEMLKFRVRTHGNRGDGTTSAWPDFGNGDVGLTQFASSGNTVTGLVEIDLNSPEPNPDLYGPYPINRIVRGLGGNAAFMLPNIRDGLLIHTGNWSTATQAWDSTMDMPNSSGCIHAHPEDVQKIYNILLSLGVKVNDNTYSGKNYPYKAQGVGVIELQA